MCGECAVLKPTQEDVKRHQSSVCAAFWRDVSVKRSHIVPNRAFHPFFDAIPSSEVFDFTRLSH